MSQSQIQLTSVTYNAATQSFEACATVHDGPASASYACSVAGPMDMSFERAARALSRDALRQHGNPAPNLRLRHRAGPGLPAALRRPARNRRLRRGLPLGQYGFFRGRAA